MSKDQSHVLVIIVGGNISLHVKEKRNEWSLEPVSAKELKDYLFKGERDDDKLLLREKDEKGEWVKVSIEELKTHDENGEKNRTAAMSRELKDSSGIDQNIWKILCNHIYSNRKIYDGFVVLHGLDTMSYTASALSFMLKNLSVPIIFTGSQLPLNYARTDAVQNIICAITLATQKTGGNDSRPLIPEVTILSHDLLFRANRTRMHDPSAYRCFESSNYPPLARIAEYLDIQTHLIRKSSRQQMKQQQAVGKTVHILDVYPGIESITLDYLFPVEIAKTPVKDRPQDKAVAGLLLRTYGMGTAPVKSDFLSKIQKLVDMNVVIVNVSQAHTGHLSLPHDPVSLRLLEHGVIFGSDATTEATYAKMLVLISDTDLSLERCKELLQTNISGEQSRTLIALKFKDAKKSNKNARNVQCSWYLEAIESEHWQEPKPDKIRQIQLRIFGIKSLEDNNVMERAGSLEFDIEIVDHWDSIEDDEPFKLAESIVRWDKKNDGNGLLTENIVIDITHCRRQLNGVDTLLQITSQSKIEWKAFEIVYYMEEE